MVEIPELLPWHSTAWSNFTQSIDRVAHATLLTGKSGVGKFQFASRLAMALLCDAGEQQPCGKCRGCHLFAATTHPDLHVITSESMLKSVDQTMHAYSVRYLDDENARLKRKSVRTTILISQIRALIEQANTASHISRNKVFVIAPVDAMTDSASNSLLKVLEEPAQNNYFFLLTENVQNLLPTISSRCQVLRLGEPDETQSEQWLAAQGLDRREIELILSSQTSPLLGMRMLRDNILTNSKKLNELMLNTLKAGNKEDMLSLVDFAVEAGESESLSTIHNLTVTLIKSNLSGVSDSVYENADIRAISKSLDVRKLLVLYDHLGKIRQEIRDGSLDRKLALEDILLEFGSIRGIG